MRILYDHQVFSLQNYGGASHYFYEIAARLSHSQDVHISVALGLNRSAYPFASLERSGTKVLGRESGFRPGLLRYGVNEVLTGAWSVFAGRFDIYHPTLYRRMPFVRARRLVATNHDCTQERFPELFSDGSRVVRAKRRLYAMADAIICVSESSRTDLLNFYDVNPDKTCVIHLGAPRLKRSAEEAHTFIERISRPYLLYVGARYAYKNFEGLLNAYASGGFARDYDLVVLGGGPFTSKELNEIRRLKLSDFVLHWDFASEPVLVEAYCRAQLFVSSSLYEGFGLPPLEAMTLGCPVLASNSASIPEICGDAASYFDPKSPGDLERGLRDALNDSTTKHRVALGLERSKRYSWQTAAEKTLDVYKQL